MVDTDLNGINPHGTLPQRLLGLLFYDCMFLACSKHFSSEDIMPSWPALAVILAQV